MTFGGVWNTIDHNGSAVYELSGDTYTYTQHNVLVGSVLGWPPHDPVDASASDTLSFLGWSIADNATEPDYDFTTPVTEPLDLYAVWGGAYTLNVKLVDTTNYPDIQYAPWTLKDSNNKPTGDGVIYLTAEKQTPRELAAGYTATAQQNYDSTYGCAFATVENKNTDKQHIRENPIEEIYYSPRDGKVHLVYGAQYYEANKKTGEPFEEILDTTTETLYILFYKTKTPQIREAR